MFRRGWAVCLFLLWPALASAQITVPNTFTAGTVASASQVNANFTALANAALNRTGGTLTGNITAGSGVTIDGVDVGAVLGGTGTPTFSTVAATTFTGALVGNADTATNATTVTNGVYTSGSYADPSWLTSLAATKLTGTIDLGRISGLMDANLSNSAAITPTKIGTGVVSLAEFNYLDGVTSSIQTQINAITSTSRSVPDGMVAFFSGGSCPTGWTEYTSARGRYIVALVSGGTNEGTVGTALSNSENRPVGQHSHTATSTDAGHTHSYLSAGGSSGGLAAGSAVGATVDTQTSGSGTASITTTVNNSGSVAGTNAPYIQLIACRPS